MNVHYLTRPGQPKLAYVHTRGTAPAIVFLGGFQSDMNGTKATFLEAQARTRGQEFLRLDYSGHGQSEGLFRDGTISAWRQDALDVIDAVIQDPVVLVGSSMGGWIGLSILLERPEKIRGFVGIAAAPDFTEGIYSTMTTDQHLRFERDGFVEEPNDYGDQPYIFTRALLEDGRRNLILGNTYDHEIPMRLLQGKQDADVDWRVPAGIQNVFPKADVQITLIEDGDHRLSRPQDLEQIEEKIRELSL